MIVSTSQAGAGKMHRIFYEFEWFGFFVSTNQEEK